MTLSRVEESNAISVLEDLLGNEGWLISLKLATKAVVMVCDFLLDGRSDVESNKRIEFHDVSNLRLNYQQNIFNPIENDLANIEVVQIVEDHTEGKQTRWRGRFEFTYGNLEFLFSSYKISDISPV